MIKLISAASPKVFISLQKKVPTLLSKILHLTKPSLVNVVFLSVVQAKKLNWQLRQRRYIPDVLSLNFTTYSQLRPQSILHFLGELYICWPQVQKQAKVNHKKPEQELAWVLSHGLLHLLGYDHEQVRPAKTMRDLEQKILTHLE